jgi:flagellar biosynthesis protein FliR
MVTLAVAWAMIPVAQRMAIPPMSSGWFEVSLLTARETVIGLILGFSSRFAVFAAQAAGQLISNEMGLQSAQIFSPGSGEISNEPSVMLEFLAQAIMFGGGFYDRWLQAFAESYHLLPMVSPGAVDGAGMLNWIGSMTSGTLLLSVKLAMPVIAGGFLLNVALLLLGRALPQLPVFQDSFLFRAVIGLFLFGGSLHLAALHLSGRSQRLPSDLLDAAALLRVIPVN